MEIDKKMSVLVEHTSNPQKLVVSATIYSREQLSALLTYLEIWGPDLPSQKYVTVVGAHYNDIMATNP